MRAKAKRPGGQPWFKVSEKETDEIERIKKLYESLLETSSTDIKSFDDFPLSRKTREGLKRSEYTTPTDIQKQAIGYALNGQDVLGASKTGTGKTLAFLLPIIERLWAARWSKSDGLGALIISPTRELAMQIFQVLKRIGCRHDFSAALLIGGTNVEYEKARVAGSNIIICTPGRLLQHLDENAQFDTGNLQILVLDEADRCLDLGFKSQLTNIVQALPTDRQTLLFSATQTRSVSELAGLSLQSPVFVSAHEHAAHATPDTLTQSYIVCDHHEKLNFLYSFLLAHRRAKIIVFMSNCKQVRFVRDAFRKMRPPQPLIALYGSMAQAKRVNVYDEFCRSKQIALFATDIAARGLDFTGVDWVLQLDCPMDAEDYIHRVGRTARHQCQGHALLALTPTQVKPMLDLLESRRIPIEEISVMGSRLQDISSKLAGVLIKEPEIKVFAQRALLAYVKTINVLKDKTRFDVATIDLDALSKSFGLAVTPRVRFLRKQQRNKATAAFAGKDEIDGLKNGADESDDDELFTVKSKSKGGKTEGAQVPLLPNLLSMDAAATSSGQLPVAAAAARKASKGAIAKKLAKRGIQVNKRVKFNEGDDDDSDLDGLPNDDDEMKNVTTVLEEAGGLDLEQAKAELQATDATDRSEFKQRTKQLKIERKRKLKEQRDAKLLSWKQRKQQGGGRPVQHYEQESD